MSRVPGGPTLSAIVLLSQFCTAQAPPPDPPEVSSHESPITFSSRVNLVSVPVVVRDREGKALGNLRQEDFQLFDKGKLQVVTKFSVEKSGRAVVEATPAGASRQPPESATAPGKPVLPDRYIAYLVDDVHLQSSDLLQARQSMNRHLDESLEPSASAAIFTTSGRMMSDFTGDREKLRKAVNSIQPWTSGPDSQQDCPPMTYYMADLLVNKDLYLDGYLYTDEQLLALVQKNQVNEELIAEMAEANACSQTTGVDTIKLVRVAARQALTYGDHDNALALGAIEDVARRISVMPGSRTMVLVSPGFLLTRDHLAHEYAALDRAIRANVTINTIDIRGLYTAIPGGDASHRGYSSTFGGMLSLADMTAANQQQDVLGELADGTGGTFFHNDNGLKEGLNLIAARPDYVYVLGYSPEDLKFDGSYHKLKVTVKNPANLTLQARRGYWAPNHATDPAEQAREELREAVFSRDEVQEIPLDLQTEFFKPSEFMAELTVVAHLDLKSLRFRKAGDRNNDTLTVVTGLFDPNGNYVSGIQKVVELHLRDQTLAAMSNTRVAMNESFSVAPGRYVVRVVVRDAEGNAMAARNGGVEIP